MKKLNKKNLLNILKKTFKILLKISETIFIISLAVILLIGLVPRDLAKEMRGSLSEEQRASLWWLLPILLFLVAPFIIRFLRQSIDSLNFKNKKSGKKRAKWRKNSKIKF